MSRYLLSLALILTLTLHGVPALAQAAKAAPATTATSGNPAKDSAAAKASDAANEKSTPAKAEPGAAKDETNNTSTPPAPQLTPEQTKAAIAASNEITAYDPEKVVGHATPWQYYYQEPHSPTMVALEKLHDFVFVIISVIVVFVMGLLLYVILRFNARANPVARRFSHNTVVEIIWTAIPILILVAIGIPSLRQHYAYTYNQNIIDHPDMTLKIVGHQWYWSYEYPDQGIAYDSNIKQEKDLVNGEPRLLTVDNPIVVPVGKVVRLQITSADVIHSWAMPSFGVKRDAVPGRLSETWFKADKEGIYYGQCSELCGKFHGFMPIEIHVVSDDAFNTWATGAKLQFAASQ